MPDIVEVSIIIPVYNGSNYLESAIRSAINQTFPSIEILVVDDGSVDDGKTKAICRKYEPKIRYIHKANGGVATALNLGISIARGRFILWLSHDDVLSCRAVELLMEAQAKVKKADSTFFIYGGWSQCTPEGQLIHEFDLDKKLTPRFQNHKIVPLLFSLVHGCSLLFSKEQGSELVTFRSDLATTQDYELWFRIMRNSVVLCVPQVLLYSRVHSAQGSITVKRHTREADNLWFKFAKALEEEPLFSEEVQNTLLFAAVAQHLYHSGYKEALAAFRKLALNRNHAIWFRVVEGALTIRDYPKSEIAYDYEYHGNTRVFSGTTPESEDVWVEIVCDDPEALNVDLFEVALLQASRKYFGLSLNLVEEFDANRFIFNVGFSARIMYDHF